MKYKTFIKSKRAISIKKEVEKIYKKITRNY